MSKNELRLFISAFVITLLCIGWLGAFLVVDASNEQFLGGKSAPMLALSCADSLHYEIDLLGQEYTADLGLLNRLSHWRKKYACLVTPRLIRALEQGYSCCFVSERGYRASSYHEVR